MEYAPRKGADGFPLPDQVEDTTSPKATKYKKAMAGIKELPPS
jgi:hypothetical protein